ncbi:MAG TPA: MFS transporter [Crenotrichaceae bacterium]|nr:MFS transporter [Crenotrichaceae bacterium]
MSQQKTSSNPSPVSTTTMILYSLPHLTHTVVLLPMALFIPAFYADNLGLPLATVGFAIAASRILDVATDPLIGIMSDRFRTRWGRRKPWLIAGTPLLMLSTWMVFVPGEKVSIHYLLIWACLLYLGFTMVDLPYKAWGAELSTYYSERSRVAAWREGMGAAGQVIFLLILMIMAAYGYTDDSQQLLAIALVVVVTVPILMLIMVFNVSERAPDRLAGDRLTGWSGLLLVFKNRAFVRTAISIILLGAALICQATLHKLVLTHVVGNPELFAPMILGEQLAALALLPFWMWVSDRIGKHRAVTLAALWVGVCSLMFPLVGAGDSVLYVSLIIIRGSSFTSIFFLSNSIAADVVDYDTVTSGQQRTGLYFSIWGMAIKFSVALGVLLGTWLPASFGFQPSALDHSEIVLDSLMMVYGWVPFLLMLCAAPLLWNFPIDMERQQQLRKQIESNRVR